MKTGTNKTLIRLFKVPRWFSRCLMSVWLRGLQAQSAAVLLAFAVAAGALCVPAASAGEPFISLGDAMTADERALSGVDRLTPDQRRYLDEWLKARFGAPAAEQASVADQTSVVEKAPIVAEGDRTLEAEIERRVAVEVAAAKAEMEAQVAQAKAEIKADDQAEQKLEPFEARITGNFRGWNGSTVFTLDNGQVWRQRHGSSYRHTSGDNRVKFDTNWLGMWEMTVVSSGRTAVVKRLD